MGAAAQRVEAADVPLERDIFLRPLLRELAGTLQDVVGLEEASGYISIVGAAVGEHINAGYRHAVSVEKLSREQVAAVLIDLKRPRETSTSSRRRRTASYSATGLALSATLWAIGPYSG
jgi:hypothetical protein